MAQCHYGIDFIGIFSIAMPRLQESSGSAELCVVLLCDAEKSTF